ncbi:MAG: helix-turn-helix transcriptional regulator [Candidatus Bathyarchaeota archaeon]|nr:helix-turn-helix transcriptional regulator [Candidatus Bathyarchaeota archaeon]
MAGKKSKGTKLKVFSGKEARLNRLILQILETKKLAKYDVFLEIRRIKGFKHEDSKTVYRRIDALDKEGWIAKNGARRAKVQGESILYELTPKGKAALRLDKKSIEEFLRTATEKQLLTFIDLFMQN